MGDIEQARTHLAIAHDIYRDRNDSIGRARVRLELGELAFWEEQYSIAQKHYERVLDLLDHDQECEAQAIALMRLGAIAFEEDEIDQAYTFYERSLKIFEELGDTLSAAGAVLELANTLQSENPSKSERLFRRHHLAGHPLPAKIRFVQQLQMSYCLLAYLHLLGNRCRRTRTRR